MSKHRNPRTRLSKPSPTGNPRRKRTSRKPSAKRAARTFMSALASVDQRKATRLVEALAALLALSNKRRKR